MKKLKLMALAVTAMLFIGMSHVNAQGKSVLIKGNCNLSNYEIITISADYEVTENKVKRDKNSTENDFLVLLKKEMDKWLSQGYMVESQSMLPNSPIIYSIFYTLVKKE